MLDVRLAHDFGAFTLDLAFAAGPGVTALTGPSGSGKSSVIAALAGLLRTDAGRIAMDGRVWFDAAAGTFVPAHRRRVGLVFQEGRLFPHRTVRQNLAYGRQRRRLPPLRDDDPVVSLLGIAHLLDRRPGRLSGGEKQRVAIGRALLSEPDLLLMDEPLASLDTARKAEILPYLARLKAETQVPIVYVSHAMEEVDRLADRVVRLGGGRIVDEDDAASTAPTGTVVALDETTMRVRFATGEVTLPRTDGAMVGARVRLT